MFVLLNKLDDRSSSLAAKTVKRLLIRAYIKRGCLFLMKRTKSAKFRAGASKRKITADYINNIQGGRNLLNRLWRDSRHTLSGASTEKDRSLTVSESNEKNADNAGSVIRGESLTSKQSADAS